MSTSKLDLVDIVSNETGTSKALASRMVDTLFDSIVSIVKSGKKVNILGFGSFGPAHRKARKGRNPQNPSQEINIAAKTVPTFKAGSKFKDAVKDTVVEES